MCNPARCRRKACQARRSLPKPLAKYVRPPKCRSCGAGLRPDRRGTHAERRYRPCECMTQLGYSFPHRPGSKFCQHAPRPSDEALQARAEAMGLAVWSDDEGVPF